MNRGLINVNNIIGNKRFFQSVTVVSYGKDEKGKPIETGRKSMMASVQPAPTHVELRKEGKYLHDAIVVYIKTIDITDGLTIFSDHVLWQGFHCEVINTSDYRSYGYIKAIAQRIASHEP